MAVNTKKNVKAYGMPIPLNSFARIPIISKRAPLSTDKAEVGTFWIDSPKNDLYVLTSIVNNYATWINCGGGSGHFDSLTVTNDATITAGDFYVTAGDVTFGALGAGVVQADATGLLSSSMGTDGQIIVATTGGSGTWATISSATLNITGGAGTLQIEYPGGTAASFITDVGGPVVPLLGATTFTNTDGNIIIDGATANTVKWNFANDIVSVASITAGVDLDMSSGICTIEADNNAANAIYLHADGGVNETINIHSDQGTGVGSVTIQSDVGGLTLLSGLASADAINITASNAAGGIDIDAGTAGMDVALANGAFALTTGTGNITIGTDAVQHNTTIGSTTGTAALTLQSGTGDVNITSTDEINLDATGVLELNSSGGVISIANDNVNQNVNISTQGVRTTTIGDATGASSVVINVGTGNLDLGVTGTAHTVRLGSTTGASASTIQTGTGAMTFTAGGIFDVNATGAVTIDSTGGTIGIGAGADANNINIGTGAAARTITLGNATGATSIVLDVGTGNLDLGVTNTAHTTRLGSTNTTSATTVQAGSGAITLSNAGNIDVITSAGTLLLDCTGVLELNSSAGIISIGNDAVAQNINIGTGGAARTIAIGNVSGATAIDINSGTGGIDLVSTGAGDITLTSADTVLVDAAGVIEINSSAAAISIGNDAVNQNINIGTAGTRTITVGSNTATTAVDLVAGSGNVAVTVSDLEIGTAGKGIVFQAGPKVVAGAGDPNGVVTAPKGSLYLRTDGSGVSDRAYINTDAGTTWTALTTAA